MPSKHGRPRPLSWAILAWTIIAIQCFHGANAAFLQATLPLAPVLTEPAELLKNGTASIQVDGRMALTVRWRVTCHEIGVGCMPRAITRAAGGCAVRVADAAAAGALQCARAAPSRSALRFCAAIATSSLKPYVDANVHTCAMCATSTKTQVVFSRPVIALGADFGAAAPPPSLVPFTLDGCRGVDGGRGRWVTTSIYRYDPEASSGWPSDLDCSFKWNPSLQAYDGAPLALPAGAPAAGRRIVSPPIKFTVLAIASASADAATDKQWSAYRGMRDDDFPEVPPDANVTLSFTRPVVPALLQSALRLDSCCRRDDARGRRVVVLPCGAPYVTRDPFTPAPSDPMRTPSTCAVVQIVPGLRAGDAVALRLPRGAVYNAAAGPAREAGEAYLWGLRRFRLPLRDNFQQLKSAKEDFDYADNGISYRRMSAWLPHGLAPGVRVADLAAHISLCRYADAYKWESRCEGVKFAVERADRGRLVISVPSFQPREHYHLTVRANSSVRMDGCARAGGTNRAALLERVALSST